MPRLPDIQALGQRPEVNPTFGVASIDGTAPGRALVQAGSEIIGIGDAIDRIQAQVTRARRATELSEALGKATLELGELEISFERDQDFKTAPSRFSEKSKAIFGRYSAGLTDDIVKQTFSREYQKLSQGKQLNILKKAATQERDFNLSSLDEHEDTITKAAAAAKNPFEREVVVNQYRLSVEAMKQAGWITDVDAGKRIRGLNGKIDRAFALRDMQADPGVTAEKLATDVNYLPNIDPVARETLIDQSYRRAETLRNQEQATLEKAWKAKGEEMMKDNWDLLTANRLTSERVKETRPYVSDSEYRSLLRAIEEKKQGSVKDDQNALADLVRIRELENDPERAIQQAFIYQKNGRIKSETLNSFVSGARAVSRQEGPRTEFERGRAFIAGNLDPGPMVQDPAAKARFALAIREYEDFAAGGKRTDTELRDRQNDVVKKYQIINMQDLVGRTSISGRQEPRSVLDQINAASVKLAQDLARKKITKDQFDKEAQKLNAARKAAEAAGGK